MNTKKTNKMIFFITVSLLLLVASACTLGDGFSGSDGPQQDSLQDFTDELNGAEMAGYSVIPLGITDVDPADVVRVGLSTANITRSASLPGAVDLTAAMPPVGNQGTSPTCGGWSIAYAAKTFFEGREEGWDLSTTNHQFSPSWLYNQVKTSAPTGGMLVADGLNLIVNRGCDTLAGFPFSVYDQNTLPNAESFKRASRFQGGTWQYTRDIARIKQILSQGRAVIFQIGVYDDFYDLSPANPVYDSTEGTLYGGHGLVFVGYDDSRNAFKFINSWGKYWGTYRDNNDTKKGRGFGWLSYSMVSHSTFMAYDVTDGVNLSASYRIDMFKPWAGYGNASGRWITADINGDHKEDLVHLVDSNYINTWISQGNGSYSVVPFRPWTSYSIANGSFFAGDFNGDGLEDIAHVVLKTNYVNTWLSQGNGTYVLKTHYAWSEYSTTSGSWLAADINGDGKQDLVHLVNSDYIHPWVSNGDGSYAIGYFKPWNGYSITGGRWLCADMNNDSKEDLVHLVDSDYINTWFSNGDTTFTVAFYRPWSGYSIKSGKWIAGDFNGDGMMDLTHLTSGDYLHTWFSLGTGGYQVTTFKSWAGYNMNTGSFFAGDYNGDGIDDIAHTVSGTNYVNTFVSSGNGSFKMDCNRGWPGYSIASGRWVHGDMDGNGTDDLVHLVNSDYMHTWMYFNY
ncbi:MAG: VCBS repeat-containing protein [Spirochaetales bacterium]|nr:VCBS repeat-containing protein [Spirochaetales bacterium]